ncbi:isomerase/hydrolase [Pseudoalteromonas phenolica]|uniref:Isomerase/hydrolase n=1 Tax=Pseudoalteromonas phenolica TaxID=161398 RepID=A0A5S3YSX2_9GAMM|nr:fumarylacetoacetate hydrolase family protein [Pseudoalteromonas phenolica]TMP80492.1 isomerase/hydrolase [Pseudoalteromonas phenolica]
MYQHQWHTGEAINLPTGKIVCIGRNYAAHAKELNNPIPSRPILFIKPSTCLQPFKEIKLAKRLGEHHYEAELALLVGETISYGDKDVLTKIAGVGLALDLTLRDVQSELKSKGHPWECAKAYDGSCPVTPFYQLESATELASAEYNYWQNSELKQHGKTQLMLFSIERLLKEITEHFTLCPGDLVLTGTPEGVGVLHHGDELQLQYQAYFPINAFVTID